MPDLYDLLDAEANRRRPADRPDFGDLVRRRTLARRRRLVGGLAALAVTGILAAGAVLLGPANTSAPSRPGPQPTGRSGRLVTVTGLLRAAGSPANATPHGLPGTIAFAASNGTIYIGRATSDGRFTVALPAGRYMVTGTSPLYNDGHAACRAASVVIVSGPQTPVIDVDCIEK
jgi:hypothetical protein